MSLSLINKLHQTPLAFIDVETTGASADFGDRVIEVGIVRYENGQPVAHLDQLIDPQRRISPGVVALTGISPDMVAGQPTFEQVLPRVTELLSGAVIIGHNIRFDLSFIHCEYRRARVPFAESLATNHVLDTLRIARRRFGRGRNGLQILSRTLGIVPPVAHRAYADAFTAAKVFEAMMEPVGGWNLDLCDVIQQQGGPMGLLPASPKESLLPLELMEALEQKGLVHMDYVDGNDSRTQRIIKPIEVKKRNGELLLVAHCQLRDDRRTFKVERIVQLTKVEEPPAPQPAPAADCGGQLDLFL
ncbi:MAG TPA: exonuclease domain-containing protein [Tepidisphaeraceae bacterium]|jgi:DNA polymerase III epsilon subunit family exonuclease